MNNEQLAAIRGRIGNLAQIRAAGADDGVADFRGLTRSQLHAIVLAYEQDVPALLAEVEAWRKIGRAVAEGTWAAAVGQAHTPYWTALIHHETNIVMEARALLGDERGSHDRDP